jgi:hypothetical protein
MTGVGMPDVKVGVTAGGSGDGGGCGDDVIVPVMRPGGRSDFSRRSLDMKITFEGQRSNGCEVVEKK